MNDERRHERDLPDESPADEPRGNEQRRRERRTETIRDKVAIAAKKGFEGEPDERRGLGKPFELWTKEDLYRRARELGVKNRSSMNKRRLIEALRDAGR
jgi:hypothetical protein